jgi:chromosome partitioning protein
VKTLILFNNKGGVGKTTLAYHLSHMLARIGYRTLAVDLDPQANLTSAFFEEDLLELIWNNGERSACSRASSRSWTASAILPNRNRSRCTTPSACSLEPWV